MPTFKITPDQKSVEKSSKRAPSYTQIIKSRAASTSSSPLTQNDFEEWPPLGKMVSPEPPPYTYVQGKARVPPDRRANIKNFKIASNIDLLDKNEKLKNSTSRAPQTTSKIPTWRHNSSYSSPESSTTNRYRSTDREGAIQTHTNFDEISNSLNCQNCNNFTSHHPLATNEKATSIKEYSTTYSPSSAQVRRSHQPSLQHSPNFTFVEKLNESAPYFAQIRHPPVITSSPRLPATQQPTQNSPTTVPPARRRRRRYRRKKREIQTISTLKNDFLNEIDRSFDKILIKFKRKATDLLFPLTQTDETSLETTQLFQNYRAITASPAENARFTSPPVTTTTVANVITSQHNSKPIQNTTCNRNKITNGSSSPTPHQQTELSTPLCLNQINAKITPSNVKINAKRTPSNVKFNRITFFLQNLRDINKNSVLKTLATLPHDIKPITLMTHTIPSKNLPTTKHAHFGTSPSPVSHLQLNCTNFPSKNTPASHTPPIPSTIPNGTNTPAPTIIQDNPHIHGVKRHTPSQVIHPHPLKHLLDSNIIQNANKTSVCKLPKCADENISTSTKIVPKNFKTNHPIVTHLLHDVLEINQDIVNSLPHPAPFQTYEAFKRIKFSEINNWLTNHIVNAIDHGEIILLTKYLAITPMTETQLASLTEATWYDTDRDWIENQYLQTPRQRRPKQQKSTLRTPTVVSSSHIATSTQVKQSSQENISKIHTIFDNCTFITSTHPTTASNTDMNSTTSGDTTSDEQSLITHITSDNSNRTVFSTEDEDNSTCSSLFNSIED